MQPTTKHIRIITMGILLAIVAGQLLWIYNLYSVQHRLLTQVKDEALQTAILREHNYRYEAEGGTIVSLPPEKRDTSRYYTKTITLKDTSFTVKYDRYDPYNRTKLSQFILKDDLPVNPQMLDSLFRYELSLRGVSPDAQTHVEYIDLTTDTVLAQAGANKTAEYTPSELKVIDIFNTLGIRGYVYIPLRAIIKKIAVPLVLTVLLLLVSGFCLFLITRIFMWREKMERMRQDSVNTMTHEFRRPLSVAVAKISLIRHYQQKGDVEKAQKYQEQGLLELDKLDAYIKHIHQLSNNTRKTIPIHKKPIELSAFCQAILEKYQETASKLVKLNLSLQCAQSILYADPLHFANIMDNFIENAIKYAKNEQAQVDITFVVQGNTLEISVQDQGIGIAAKDLPRIFDKFYRSNNQQVQRKVGFGLGLTYVKALVEAHEGTIEVESKIGIGTKFTVYFPLQNDAE